MTELRVEPDQPTGKRKAVYSPEYVSEMRRGSRLTWNRYIELALELDRARDQVEIAIRWIQTGRSDLALVELQTIISDT